MPNRYGAPTYGYGAVKRDPRPRPWIVILGGRTIETLAEAPHMSAADLRKELVEVRRYNPGIRLERA